MTLERCYNENPNIIEIGVDEVGRGPMFGRVYCAAVILPKDNSFKHELMKERNAMGERICITFRTQPQNRARKRGRSF